MIIDHVYKEINTCTGCSACYSICPQNAIVMKPDDKGFLYPVINHDVCVQCGLCISVCQTHKSERYINQDRGFSFVNNSKEILLESSSGGVFTYLANQVIQKGGRVCGAVFDSDYHVKHLLSDSKEDISHMRGSKYVQSDLVDVFKEIKESLENGIFVLFSGTPCQVIGLKNYLQIDYDHLVCVDVICHGIPSPRIYDEYLQLIRNDCGEIQELSFRNKENGYLDYGVLFQTKNKRLLEHHKHNRYLKGYLGDLYSRDCCSQCPAKERLGYASDITMGDLWITNYSHIDNSNGVSLVIVHTEKGMSMFSDTILEKVPMNEVKKCNPSFYFSHIKNADSDYFWSVFFNKGLDKAYKSIYYPSFFRKIQLKLRKI